MKRIAFGLLPMIFAALYSISSPAAEEPAKSNSRLWEVTGGTAGSFNLEKPKFLNVGGNVGYFVENLPLQISFGMSFVSFEDPTLSTTTNLFLAAGPIFNLNPDDVENSIYAGARFGLVRVHSGQADITVSSFAWQAFVSLNM
jgi:hypothetical protein